MSPARDVVLAPSHHRLVFARSRCWSAALDRAGGDPRRAWRDGPAAGRAHRPPRRAVRGRAHRRRGPGRPASATGEVTVISSRTAVEDRHQRRADQHGVGHAERVGIGRRQLLHQPHHVVAEIAEHAGRHRRGIFRQLDAAFGEQARAAIAAAARRAARRPVGRSPALAVDRGLAALAPPDQVGVEADHRIAAAHRAALDQFEQEGIARVARQLQVGRDRRFEIGDQPRPDDLRLAPLIGAGEAVVVGRDHHWYWSGERV